MANVTGTLRIKRNNQSTVRLTQSLSESDRPFNATAKIDYALGGPCPAAVELMGLEANSRSRRVFAATLTVDGLHHDLPGQCCIKMACGSEEFYALMREHDLYSHQLLDLGGIAVPRCHGFFGAMVNGELVGCLVLDLCVGTIVVPKDQALEQALTEGNYTAEQISSYRKGEEREEFYRLIMAAICKLHSVGVIHDGLYHFAQNTIKLNTDYRHFVMQGQSVLIVDFSTARPHSHFCPGGTPHVRRSNRIDEQPGITCTELFWSDLLFGEHDLE